MSMLPRPRVPAWRTSRTAAGGRSRSDRRHVPPVGLRPSLARPQPSHPPWPSGKWGSARRRRRARSRRPVPAGVGVGVGVGQGRAQRRRGSRLGGARRDAPRACRAAAARQRGSRRLDTSSRAASATAQRQRRCPQRWTHEGASGTRQRGSTPAAPGAHLVAQVAHKDAEVVLGPLEERGVHPALARRLAHDAHLLAAGADLRCGEGGGWWRRHRWWSDGGGAAGNQPHVRPPSGRAVVPRLRIPPHLECLRAPVGRAPARWARRTAAPPAAPWARRRAPGWDARWARPGACRAAAAAGRP